MLLQPEKKMKKFTFPIVVHFFIGQLTRGACIPNPIVGKVRVNGSINSFKFFYIKLLLTVKIQYDLCIRCIHFTVDAMRDMLKGVCREIFQVLFWHVWIDLGLYKNL